MIFFGGRHLSVNPTADWAVNLGSTINIQNLTLSPAAEVY